jgi:hypothetical protein
LPSDRFVSHSLLEALKVEVVLAVGFNDGPVLLADMTLMILVFGLLPGWGNLIGRKFRLLLKAPEIVNNKEKDD